MGANSPLRRLSRRVFRQFGRYVADLPRFTASNPSAIRRVVDIATPDTLRALSAEPSGALLVSAHFGNWELAGALVASLGRPLIALARPAASPALERILEDLRRRRGLCILPPHNAPSAILRALRSGNLVALLADRDFTARAPLTPFFGRPAPLPRGPAWFAWQARVPVYVGCVLRTPSNRFRFHLLPPLRPETFATESALRLALASRLETLITLSPTQWYPFTPLWPPS